MKVGLVAVAALIAVTATDASSAQVPMFRADIGAYRDALDQVQHLLPKMGGISTL